MKYKSSNGTFFYYDRALYRWNFADPTMLFLLGFESVTAYDKSLTDCILISKNVYDNSLKELVPLENFNIFEELYSYLSNIHNVEDFDYYIKFNCYGLKLLLNELTGTDSDRTIPIIFKTDTNSSVIDLSSTMYRLPESSRLNKSYYDLQAQKILDIFADCNYTKSLADEQISRSYKLYKSLDSEKPSVVYYNNRDFQTDSIAKAVILYDIEKSDIYTERSNNYSVTRLFDYKAMYSYSLGVLYGCLCLGFDPKLIFRIDPKYWYTESYLNLVRTAYVCFKHHYTTNVINNDIQENKLWNFDQYNLEVLGSDKQILFYNDEANLVNVYTENNQVVANPVLYSFNASKINPDTLQENPEIVGKYIIYPNVTSAESWQPVKDDIVTSDKGLVSVEDKIVRYIGNDPINIFPAYTYYTYTDSNNEKQNYYLRPSDSESTDLIQKIKYFIPTGILGWTDFDPDLFKVYTGTSSTNKSLIYKNALTLEPESFSDIISRLGDNTEDFIKKAKSKRSDTPGQIVYFYEALLYKDNVPTVSGSDNDVYLYGIFNNDLKEIDQISDISSLDDSHFDIILSKYLFNKLYEEIQESSVPEEYKNNFIECYNVDDSIWLYLDNNKDSFWCEDPNNDDSDPNTEPRSYYGYTLSPATALDGFYYTETTLTQEDNTAKIVPTMTSVGIRYHEYKSEEDSDHNYWSNADHFNDDANGNSQSPYWHENLPKSFYIYDGTTTLYRNIQKIIENSTSILQTYKGYICTDYNLDNYGINDLHYDEQFVIIDYDNLFSHSENYDNKFDNHRIFSIEYLYNNYGITQNPCYIITEDDDGYSLLDENGDPLVWYDPINNSYWNGLFGINKWQKDKPSIYNQEVYDSYTNKMITVYNDTTNHKISINGDSFITYDDFYNIESSDGLRYGFIRETLKIFNPNNSGEIIDCYHDTDLTYDRYTIPSLNVENTGTLHKWVSREYIHDTLGYWFVDGRESLYDGEESIDYVYDDDHTD